MRIFHIAYQQLRRYGETRVSWARKLTNGYIKDDHFIEVFSDRDVAAFEAPFGIRDLGVGRANKRLLESVDAVEPDLLIAGHCDMISNQTLREIRRRHPAIKIIHCNVDPLFVPENVERIKHRASVVDAVFVSTGRRELVQFEGLGARVYHMPNYVEPSVECLDNSERDDLSIDLLFCSNATAHSKRLDMVSWLKQELGDSLVFKTYGSFGEPPVWGRNYDRVLAETKMGLNLNRQEGDYWYSSDRMAQLAGNGILQFAHDSNRFDELLPRETIVYYSSQEDLLSRIREFHFDDEKRKDWAGRTRQFFHSEMNNSLCARYILEATFLQPFSHDYVWARDINLDGTYKSRDL